MPMDCAAMASSAAKESPVVDGNQDDDACLHSEVLLITANVGSLFEDPVALLQPWLKEFLGKIVHLQPQFLALHLQEVGGKTYEKSMEYVQEFIRCLCEAQEMSEFAFIRIYMDEDFNSAEHFTALGNLYFAHKNLQSVRIWNFLTHDWESAADKNIYSGNIEAIATKEKSKFPQHFFPECKWSRKGFMRTRWELNHTVIDLVNIHLFHDASNLAASEEFPSVYCKTRRRALVHTLERFHLDDKNGVAPYFVFGDFNFRCDTGGVIKELTENLTAHRVQNIKSDSTKVHYRNSVGDNVLTIGKKEFNHADHQLKFKESWLKNFDRELDALSEILVEYPILFPPSYPYEEDPEMPTDYMSTRCPSWCDRILMSPQAKDIILDKHPSNPYSIIGESVCMGDHKPIYLNIRLKPNQGLTSAHLHPKVPDSLRQVVAATLGGADDTLWREQSQLDANNISGIIVKTRYVQINQISKANDYTKVQLQEDNHGDGVAVAAVEQEILLNKATPSETVAILKETTV